MAKESFPEVVIGEETIAIEGSVRKGKNQYATCRYFTVGFDEYLGAYDAPEAPDDLLTFCVLHYSERE